MKPSKRSDRSHSLLLVLGHDLAAVTGGHQLANGQDCGEKHEESATQPEPRTEPKTETRTKKRTEVSAQTTVEPEPRFVRCGTVVPPGYLLQTF
jgi:hypothetical protein